MAKPTNRDKILNDGLAVVLRRGFGGASVRDIVRAAGVPQGSFTNHFVSKEAFGLEVLERYFAGTAALLERTLRNDALAPLVRLRAFIEASEHRLGAQGIEHGCLYGNLSGEAIGHSEPLRARLAAIFDELRAALSSCLRAAVARGDLSASLDADGVAEFIVGGLQGAILLAKVQRSGLPVERFAQLLFSMVLRRPDGQQSAPHRHETT
jgi:TetR/AcrR family transcriptional repressor of nem operon